MRMQETDELHTTVSNPCMQDFVRGARLVKIRGETNAFLHFRNGKFAG